MEQDADRPAKRQKIRPFHSHVESLLQQRQKNDEKLKSRFESIFDKYGRDFNGIGDEIDVQTGRIVVNNGHIMGMSNEKDAGNKRRIARRPLRHNFHPYEGFRADSQFQEPRKTASDSLPSHEGRPNISESAVISSTPGPVEESLWPGRGLTEKEKDDDADSLMGDPEPEPMPANNFPYYQLEAAAGAGGHVSMRSMIQAAGSEAAQSTSDSDDDLSVTRPTYDDDSYLEFLKGNSDRQSQPPRGMIVQN